MAAKAKQKFREFLFEESGEVNIVAMLILIAIAVALAVLFKEQISELVSGLFNQIKGDAGSIGEGVDYDPSATLG
ncbi:MAG TPA: flagellin-like protein [Firmicutes bacterium]|nr:flagellin-like protein [Bacillota bacterium]